MPLIQVLPRGCWLTIFTPCNLCLFIFYELIAMLILFFLHSKILIIHTEHVHVCINMRKKVKIMKILYIIQNSFSMSLDPPCFMLKSHWQVVQYTYFGPNVDFFNPYPLVRVGISEILSFWCHKGRNYEPRHHSLSNVNKLFRLVPSHPKRKISVVTSPRQGRKTLMTREIRLFSVSCPCSFNSCGSLNDLDMIYTYHLIF